MIHRNYLYILLAVTTALTSCTLESLCEHDDDSDEVKNCDDSCPHHYDKSIIDKKIFEEKNCSCIDSDEDDIIDCLDPCPYDADTEPTECGCGFEPEGKDAFMTCPDSDKIADKCPGDSVKTEPGACGCGVSDYMVRWDGETPLPTSECPYAEGHTTDRCPFDPNKVVPGKCGCGSTEVGVKENDPKSTCADDAPVMDKCPYDDNKIYPGVCGCGVEDSAVNLKDSDNDGTVDCLDECPDNPYKIIPGDTGCEHWDTDGDGVEDGDDFCPYNPNIISENELSDDKYLTCNVRLEKNNNKLIFEVWDSSELLIASDELMKYADKINLKSYEKDISEGVINGSICKNNSSSCFSHFQDDASKSTTYACVKSDTLDIGLIEFHECISCIPIPKYSTYYCSQASEQAYTIPYNQSTKDKRLIISLMKDINLYKTIPNNSALGFGKWESKNLYHVEFNGNNHTISCAKYAQQIAINNPLFLNMIDTYIHDLNINLNYQGNVSSTFATYAFKSLAENININANMVIQGTIFDESNDQTKYGSDNSTDTNKTSAFIGFAKESTFDNITVNINSLYSVINTSISGFSNAIDSITATNIKLNFGSIGITRQGKIAGFSFKINGANTLKNIDIKASEQIYIEDTGNFYGFSYQTMTSQLVENLHLTFNEIQVNHGYFYGVAGNHLENDNNKLSLNNAFIEINKAYANDYFSGLGVLNQANNVSLQYNDIDVSYASLIGHIKTIHNMNAIFKTIHDGSYCKDYRHGHTTSHGPVSQPDPCFDITMRTDHNMLLTTSELDSFYISADNKTDAGSQALIADSIKNVAIDSEIIDVKSSTISNLSLLKAKSYKNALTNTTKLDNYVVASVHKNNSDCSSLLYLSSANDYCRLFIPEIDYHNKYVSYIKSKYSKINLKDTCISECKSSSESCNYCYIILFSDICYGYFFDYPDALCNAIDATDICDDIEHEDYMNKYELVLSECADAIEAEKQSFITECVKKFENNCTEYLKFTNAYWYRHDESENAFCTESSDEDISCIENQFTPFTDSDTDAIVKKLGTHWKSRTVTDTDADGHTQTIKIPWYYPDTAWLDSMKSDMGIK